MQFVSHQGGIYNMNAIYIEKTEETPAIIMDKVKGIFEISGRSLPENASEFYEPILDWIQDYSESPNEKSIFSVKLEYFNTASSKSLLDVLTTLEDIKGMSVNWFYDEEDEDMLEAAEEYSEMVEVPFEIIVYDFNPHGRLSKAEEVIPVKSNHQ